MSINLKLVLFKGKTHADGTHPIQLQFYINGKQERKGIYRCHPDDWDADKRRVKPKVQNSAYINAMLSEKYTEYERELIKVMTGASPLDFFGTKAVLTLDAIIKAEMVRFEKQLKTGEYKRYEGYQKELAQYMNSERLNIRDIDLKWYEDLVSVLESEIVIDSKVIKRSNNGSTIQKKVKSIRRLIEKHSGITPKDDVKRFRVPTKKPIKQKLSPAELLRIELLELPENQQISVVRDFFVLQVYLRGSRVGALLQAYSHQFKDGRYVATNDAGKNNVGAKLIPKAQAIVDKYYGLHERLFPFYSFTPDPIATDFENKRRSTKRKEAATSIVNKYLKQIAKLAEINKPLSSHIARHTFAKMALEKINNPMITMELIGHKSLSIHQGYLNELQQDDVMDAATDDIFGG